MKHESTTITEIINNLPDADRPLGIWDETEEMYLPIQGVYTTDLKALVKRCEDAEAMVERANSLLAKATRFEGDQWTISCDPAGRWELLNSALEAYEARTQDERPGE